MTYIYRLFLLLISTVAVAASPIPANVEDPVRGQTPFGWGYPAQCTNTPGRLVRRDTQCHIHRDVYHPNLSGNHVARISAPVQIGTNQYSLTITSEGATPAGNTFVRFPTFEFSNGSPIAIRMTILNVRRETAFPAIEMPAYTTQVHYLADAGDPRYPADWRDGDEIDMVIYWDFT